MAKVMALLVDSKGFQKETDVPDPPPPTVRWPVWTPARFDEEDYWLTMGRPENKGQFYVGRTRPASTHFVTFYRTEQVNGRWLYTESP